MDDLELYNHDLKLETWQSKYRLEQLRQQSMMETNQLHAQIKHQGEFV